MKDYYSILGVNENATEEEISKAFKKLSLQWHPDRWVKGTAEEKKAAEEKFKEIAEAKEVLTNAQKRQQYDMERNGSFPGMGGFNPFDFIRQHQRNVIIKGDDVYITIDLTFKEAYEGTTKDIKYKKNVKCHHCNGTGSEDGKKENCPYCNGTGMITETQQRGNMFFQNMHPCQHCHGTGKMIKNPCKHCNGTGFENIDCYEKLAIPSGVFTGARMNLKEKGSSPIENGINGDLLIDFNVSINPYYERPDETTLVHHEKVPFNDALIGCEREVDVPDGTKIKIKLHELTKDGEEFVQYGKGFPNLINGDTRRGNYVVVIDYVYPNKLTKKQQELLKNFNND